jgi:hypothetical protein
MISANSAYSQINCCDSIVITCEIPTDNICVTDPHSACYGKCRRITVRNNCPTGAKIKAIYLLCTDASSTGISICAAYSSMGDGCNWAISPLAGWCNTDSLSLLGDVGASTDNPDCMATYHNFVDIYECGCCKFTVRVIFDDGHTICNKELSSAECGCGN